MFDRFIKIIFTYFIISFSYVNYSQSQDLTKQEVIEKIIYFKGVEGESHYYEPSEIIFYTGKLYKLILKMSVIQNITFLRILFQIQFLLEKYRLILMVKN